MPHVGDKEEEEEEQEEHLGDIGELVEFCCPWRGWWMVSSDLE